MSAMLDGRPIVVGVDSSDVAQKAAVWAAGQAERRKVDVRLVHAIDMSKLASAGGYVPPPDFVAAIESAGRDLLDGVRAEIHRTYPDLVVQVDLGYAHPVSVLVEESERAGLLVVGTREQNAVQSLLAGSTAVGVAAHARCPTAVIRTGSSGGVLSTGPVVVGVDGSPASESAVAIAFEEASARGVELVAVHAWTEFASDKDYIYAYQSTLDWGSIEVEQREMLAERLAGWQEKYPDVTVRRVVMRGKAAQMLLSHAADAQLLVVGSRGRGGFTGMVLGSVSQKLIHHATCPLIIARPATTG
ncbi:MAG TPA: universal stress protein [Pseudonocardia sp.]|uniref:universal stress protein n=1 Tax=Pseudonocardia sp. TaxID=60912 RepID=UPI002BF395EA|nr:universal stress protein [Pseudonocardia sp.]HTF55393.1 universal stress protein [Pseudonocardia sp.]